MKRYDYYKWKSFNGGGFYHVKKRGKWVKWKDVKRLLKNLENNRKEKQEEIKYKKEKKTLK